MATNQNNNQRQQGGRDLSPAQAFRQHMEGNMRAEIAKQLPPGIEPDRFIRTAVSTVQMRPELLRANRTSLFGAFMQAAKDGLLPDDREATIQIYKTKVSGPDGNDQWVDAAQYMPMVGGLIAKMYDAGATYVDGAAVYEKDHFRFTRGDNPCVDHEPYLGDEDPGEIVAAYAIIKLRTGETKREVMPKRDINKVRESSKAKNGPGWKNWEDQFAIKAVLKRAYKQVPHTSENLRRVIEGDNEAMDFDFRQQDAKDTAAVTGEGVKAIAHQPGKSSRLSSIIGQERQKEAVPASNGHDEDAADQAAGFNF